MELSKFEEAERKVETIRNAKALLGMMGNESFIFTPEHIGSELKGLIGLIYSDPKVTRSFLRWVENEKQIAEQQLKEL